MKNSDCSTLKRSLPRAWSEISSFVCAVASEMQTKTLPALYACDHVVSVGVATNFANDKLNFGAGMASGIIKVDVHIRLVRSETIFFVFPTPLKLCRAGSSGACPLKLKRKRKNEKKFVFLASFPVLKPANGYYLHYNKCGNKKRED